MSKKRKPRQGWALAPVGDDQPQRREWIAGQIPKLRKLIDALNSFDTPAMLARALATELDRVFRLGIDPAKALRHDYWDGLSLAVWDGLADPDKRLAGLCERLLRLLSIVSVNKPMPAGTVGDLRRVTDALEAWPGQPPRTKQINDEAGSKTRPRRGGSRPRYAPEADARIANNFKASGLSVKDFATTHNMKYAAVKAAIDRHRKRK